MTARLILICHGSTDAIRSASFPADEPLEEPSATRAAALAGTLPKADRCWTSPELRTRQTAQSLGLSANVEPMLRDCDYGRWAGRRFDEVQASEPDAISSWLRDPAAAPHGGEPITNLMRRVGEWLAAEQARDQRGLIGVVIVGHLIGGPLEQAAPHGGEPITNLMRRVGEWLAAEQARDQRGLIGVVIVGHLIGGPLEHDRGPRRHVIRL